VFGALIPGNPTSLSTEVATTVKNAVGLAGAWTLQFLYGFVWTAPRKQYFETLALAKKADDVSAKAIATAADGAENKWVTKTDVYRQNIESLSETVQRLEKEKAALTYQLNKKRRDQTFADHLTERYTWGLNEVMNWERLRKSAEFNDEDVKEWIERERLWTQGTRNILVENECTDQEIAHFWLIHEYPFVQFHQSITSARNCRCSQCA
jgi:hypothetical protein